MKKKYDKKFIKAFDNKFSIANIDKKSEEYLLMLKLIKNKLTQDNETKKSEIVEFTELMEKAKVQEFKIYIYKNENNIKIMIFDEFTRTVGEYIIFYIDLTQNQKSLYQFLYHQYSNIPRDKELIDKCIEIFKASRNVAIARNNVYIDYIDNE